MLRLDIITVLPELLESPFAHSILKRAVERKKTKIHVHQLREFAEGPHQQVDDYQYGGGAGMVMKVEPLAKCIRHLQSQRTYDEIIYLSPDGKRFTQQYANQLSLKNNLMLICGHYKGIDERIRALFVTSEISIGDYVLSGGELAAAVVADAVIRLLPGVLNDETSALTDSFQDNLLAPPVYTRPENFEGLKVPEVLLSGHQRKVDEWRYRQAVEKTKKRRPDLLKDDGID